MAAAWQLVQSAWASSSLACAGRVASVRWQRAQERSASWCWTWHPAQARTESAGARVTGVVWQAAQRSSACTGCENGTSRSRGAAGGRAPSTVTARLASIGAARAADSWHWAQRPDAGAW